MFLCCDESWGFVCFLVFFPHFQWVSGGCLLFGSPPISDGSWGVCLLFGGMSPFPMGLGRCLFFGFPPLHFQWDLGGLVAFWVFFPISDGSCMLPLLFPLFSLHFRPASFLLCAFPICSVCFLCISDGTCMLDCFSPPPPLAGRD